MIKRSQHVFRHLFHHIHQSFRNTMLYSRPNVTVHLFFQAVVCIGDVAYGLHLCVYTV